MLVVVALGGNALLRRGEPADVEAQRHNVTVAVEAIAELAAEHELVVTHGNGPQVGLLALQGEAYSAVKPYPLDVLGAETEGMIGYLLDQELVNRLGHAPGRDAAHAGDRRRRRPGLRAPDEVRRPGLLRTRWRTAGRRTRLDRRPGRTSTGAASSPRPSPARSSSWARSGCWWTPACW